MYKWQKIKAMSVQGKGIKTIARELKMSKNTVRKYLKDTTVPIFHPRTYHHLLDEYQALIASFVEKHFIGTRIYTELKKLGYTGSLSTVHRYLATLKKEQKRRAKITTRVETSPGKQMQYDWTEWILPVDDTPIKIYFHQVICSYSRKKFYTFSTRITAPICLESAFRDSFSFIKIPEELVIDNCKQLVVIHGKERVVRFTDDFLFFCGLFGIQTLCLFSPSTLKPKARENDPFCLSKTNSYRGLRFRPFPSSNLSSLNLLRKKVIVGTQSSRKPLMSGLIEKKPLFDPFPRLKKANSFLG
jgi:transposase